MSRALRSGKLVSTSSPTTANVPASSTSPIQATTPLLSLEQYRSRYPNADPRLFFPGQSKPASKMYAPVKSESLPEDDDSMMMPETTSEEIHARLMRLLTRLPSIAVYPYLICPLVKSGTSMVRPHRNKEGDDKFKLTLASMLTWELGGRKMRMGIVQSLTGVGGSNSAPYEWVLCVADREPGQGKMVIIFEEAASRKMKAVGSARRSDMIKDAVKAVKELVDTHSYKRPRVFWGGGRACVGMEDEARAPGLWLETSMLFMEKFGAEVASQGGVVSEDLLKKWEFQRV